MSTAQRTGTNAKGHTALKDAASGPGIMTPKEVHTAGYWFYDAANVTSNEVDFLKKDLARLERQFTRKEKGIKRKLERVTNRFRVRIDEVNERIREMKICCANMEKGLERMDEEAQKRFGMSIVELREEFE